MDTSLTLSERIGAMGDDVREQFSDLDFSDPAHWPAVPRYTFLFIAALLVFGLSWYAYLGDSYQELANLNLKESQLRDSFSKKLAKTATLTGLKQQRDRLRGYVQELELQLPDQTGMNELLTEMNRLGQIRNLQFALLRPAPMVQKAHYAEIPINFRLTGTFHNMAAFAADIAQNRRVVHLHDLALTSKPDGALTVEGTLRIYRHLEKPDPSDPGVAKGGNK